MNIWKHLDTLGSKVSYGITKAWKHLGAFGCIQWYLNVLWEHLGVFGTIWKTNPTWYHTGMETFVSIWVHLVAFGFILFHAS